MKRRAALPTFARKWRGRSKGDGLSRVSDRMGPSSTGLLQVTTLTSTDIATSILELANRTVPPGTSPAVIAELEARRLRPLVYMRYPEFDALLPEVDFEPGMEVVDFSSPQWFTLYLAHRFPATRFTYTNIIDEELAAFEALATLFGLRNLSFRKVDLRTLPFPDSTFDRAISISVIEHVYPEVGGDVAAMREIRRVMKPDARLLITVPCKAARNVVYVERPVYERKTVERNFYAREYDIQQFSTLVSDAGFAPVRQRYIVESPGLLALDDIEWGPSRGTLRSKLMLLARRAAERLTGRSLDRWLARRYLRVSDSPDIRLVNVAASLARTK